MVVKRSTVAPVRVPLLRYRAAGKGRLLGGIDVASLLRHAQLDPDKADLAQDEHILLLTSNVDLTGDESHGLGGERLRTGFASIGLRVMTSAPNLGAALAALGRYFAATTPVFVLHTATEGGRVRIRLEARGRDVASGLMLEDIWLNSIYAFACWYVGRKIPVIEATTRDPVSLSVNRVHLAAGPNLRTGGDHSFVMLKECLSWPRAVDHVAEPLWEAMNFWIRAAETNQQKTMAAFVQDENSYLARLRLQDTGAFNLSDRQRRRHILQSGGPSFRSARAQAIMQRAEHLLRNTDEPVEAIAARLGYREERSFRRFVKAHMGCAPTAIRRRGPMPAASPTADVAARIRLLMRKLNV